MGADYTIDLTGSIRRVLNILAILEKRKGYELSSSDIKNELNKFIAINEDDSKIIPRFKEHILEWESDYGLRLIKGANGDPATPRSPFKFNINKEDLRNRNAYKELLTIAFSLLLIRKSELNFLDVLLKLENPLWTLTVILDSVKYKDNPRPFSLKYVENDTIITQEVYFHKIENNNNGDWFIHVTNHQTNTPIVIPISNIRSADFPY